MINKNITEYELKEIRFIYKHQTTDEFKVLQAEQIDDNIKKDFIHLHTINASRLIEYLLNAEDMDDIIITIYDYQNESKN